ncbi:MAG: ribose 5-phosphate isomerase B [Firmicutes bacterium]|nr:ribose 5-phosphate isomerase B [Bacillota bacterium]
MPVALGADHGGYRLKEEIRRYLEQKGLPVQDFGVYSEDPADYPDLAEKVADAILDGRCSWGLLVCGTGIGMSIAANKIAGVRAALCHDSYTARMARAHNDANILVLGGRVLGGGSALEIVDAWLAATFTQEERHRRRLAKIAALEHRKEKSHSDEHGADH